MYVLYQLMHHTLHIRREVHVIFHISCLSIEKGQPDANDDDDDDVVVPTAGLLFSSV